MNYPTLKDLPPPPDGKMGWPWTGGNAHLPPTMPDGKPWPKISIVTPNCNYGHFIEETIRSVLLQSYPNLEYIIIDDGSTDNSVEIIKKYEKWLTYWTVQPNRGQYDAINKGFSRATGEIMAWLNSDDMYCPWALKTISSIMSQFQEVGWLTSLNPGLWDVDGFCLGFVCISGYSKEAFLDGRYLPYQNKICIGWIQQESTFWRSSLWHKAGGYLRTDLEIASDFDLWARFFLHTDLYGTVSPLSGFRVHTEQQSTQLRQYLTEATKILTSMRRSCDWRPDFFKTLCLALDLNIIHRILVLKKAVDLLYGYQGKRIVRKGLNSRNNTWAIEEYRFFCK